VHAVGEASATSGEQGRADGLLLTDSKGDPIRRNALGHLWRRAATGAKVVGFTPHDLRHDAASTTLDAYAHLWPDSEDTTRRVLDAGLERVVSHASHAEPVSE